MDTYSLSRNFFNWCFDNPEKVSPNHTAIYFFAIEHCNRLGGKEKFGFPTMMACDAVGIKKPQTYIKYFNDLEHWGFFKVHERSKNQYSANIISLVYALPKKGKALDKAFVKHVAKQTESMGQSNSPIIKQVNNETSKPINNLIDFEVFWKTYPNKTGKAESNKKWDKLKPVEQEVILEFIPNWVKHKPFEGYNYPMATTFLNQRRWEDELVTKPTEQKQGESTSALQESINNRFKNGR